MYAVVRRYDGVTDPAEAGRRVKEEFVPLLRNVSGFVAYYWVNAGHAYQEAAQVLQQALTADPGTAEVAERMQRRLARWLTRGSDKTMRPDRPVDKGSWIHKMVTGLARPACGALGVRCSAGRRLRPRPAFRRLDPWLLTRLSDEVRGPRRIGAGPQPYPVGTAALSRWNCSLIPLELQPYPVGTAALSRWNCSLIPLELRHPVGTAASRWNCGVIYLPEGASTILPNTSPASIFWCASTACSKDSSSCVTTRSAKPSCRQTLSDAAVRLAKVRAVTDRLPHALRSDARDNRELILDAARRAFAAEGLDVPMREIARRAGVGPGTLYRRFPTKEMLVTEAFTDEMCACHAIVERGAGRPRSVARLLPRDRENL